MKDKIQYELSRIEREYGVRVLFAAEAGARAWGIASADAGHDVRFIYAAPSEKLPVGTAVGKAAHISHGVIERPVCRGLGLIGVDLQRALGLLLDSHAPLLELLRSPIVYAQDERFAKRFRSLAGRFFDAERTFGYYLRLAERIEREHLREGRSPLTRDIEALRAALAARWVNRKAVPPPVEFTRLVDESVNDVLLRLAIGDILLRKRQGAENAPVVRDKITSEFLRESLAHLRHLRASRERTTHPQTRLTERKFLQHPFAERGRELLPT